MERGLAKEACRKEKHSAALQHRKQFPLTASGKVAPAEFCICVSIKSFSPRRQCWWYAPQFSPMFVIKQKIKPTRSGRHVQPLQPHHGPGTAAYVCDRTVGLLVCCFCWFVNLFFVCFIGWLESEGRKGSRGEAEGLWMTGLG